MTEFDKHQVIWLGGISLTKGVVTELARRRNLIGASPIVDVR